MVKYILAAVLYGSLVFSQVISDDVYVTGEKSYGLKEACEFMGHKNFPLIDIKSATQLDCMRAIVDTGEFCKKKQPEDPYLARGFIRRSQKQVVCQSANKVIFKYNCAQDSTERCKDASIGCYEFKDKFAIRLETVHHSFLTLREGIKVLNCYWAVKDSSGLEKIIK